MSARREWAWVGASLVVGCGGSEDLVGEPTGRTRDAIIAGRPSTAAENYAVRIVSATADLADPRISTGTLVAPNIVVAARHALRYRQGPAELSCKSDGTPVDPTDPAEQDTRTPAPSEVAVFWGTDTATTTRAYAKTLLTANELGLCRSDIAVIILAEPLGEVRVPIRTDVIRLRESFSMSGWGFGADDTAGLPASRSTLDRVLVTEVGPAFIPGGTFATAGRTSCFGDSGSGAMFAGALGGVYSRIEGSHCTIEQARNIFTMTAPHRALFERAFREAGQPPWFVDTATSCPDGDSSCGTTDACSGSSEACAPPAAEPTTRRDTASCGSRSPSSTSAAPLLSFVALTSLVALRRRGRRCSALASRGPTNGAP